jgi:HPt (histidine-containing phosphotransfer) domain-containing protein
MVALTANAMREDRDACLKAGMDDFLTKPVQPTVLQEALVRAAEARRCSAAGQGQGNEDNQTATAPADDPTPAPVLEPNVLQDLRQMRTSSPDLIRDLLNLFRTDVPRQIRAMTEAVTAGDAERLRQVAHSVKGAAANLGAWKLARLCKELEQLARAGTAAAGASLVPELMPAYEAVCQALEGEMGVVS